MSMQSFKSDGLVCTGNETNCPHLVVEHSPDGFNWGYGGSGPADLALNCVEAILRDIGFKGNKMQCFSGSCFSVAFYLHQDFKWQFIATMPKVGGKIDYETMKKWVEGRLITSHS